MKMGLFNLFKKKDKQIQYNIDINGLNDLLDRAIDNYFKNACPCAYPRFIQIVSIDCFDYGESFKSRETEMLIKKSRKYFIVSDDEVKNECHGEKWICKKCSSEFQLSWSDLSIALDRETLKPINIQTPIIGKNVRETIPLYWGLVGHSYPSKYKIINVSFDDFENYILEK